MTSLRTQQGLNLAHIEEQFGKKIRSALQRNSHKFIATEKLWLNESRLQLTREGKLFADGIAAALFFLEAETAASLPAVNDVADDVNN